MIKFNKIYFENININISVRTKFYNYKDYKKSMK